MSDEGSYEEEQSYDDNAYEDNRSVSDRSSKRSESHHSDSSSDHGSHHSNSDNSHHSNSDNEGHGDEMYAAGYGGGGSHSGGGSQGGGGEHGGGGGQGVGEKGSKGMISKFAKMGFGMVKDKYKKDKEKKSEPAGGSGDRQSSSGRGGGDLYQNQHQGGYQGQGQGQNHYSGGQGYGGQGYGQNPYGNQYQYQNQGYPDQNQYRGQGQGDSGSTRSYDQNQYNSGFNAGPGDLPPSNPPQGYYPSYVSLSSSYPFPFPLSSYLPTHPIPPFPQIPFILSYSTPRNRWVVVKLIGRGAGYNPGNTQQQYQASQNFHQADGREQGQVKQYFEYSTCTSCFSLLLSPPSHLISMSLVEFAWQR